MSKKIIFIVSNIYLPRCINRINEFVVNGYETEVYYFERPMYENKTAKVNATMHSLGVLGSGEQSYLRRMPAQYRSIRNVVTKRHKEDVVFYLFGFDMALIYFFCKRGNPYIFEESDLRHTYFKPKLLSKLLEILDKMIIRRSLITAFTSEGFYQYHFRDGSFSDYVIVPNRLNPEINKLGYKTPTKHFNKDNIKIGFVGSIRFDTVYNFVDVYCKSFPKCEFHFYGSPVLNNIEQLDKYPNCFFHGKFTSPYDLPDIYSNLDLVLSTYDPRYENVKYAEPNKYYESIYFEVPIIVSSDTYLAEKVRKTGVGYSINAFNDNEIIQFITNLTEEDYESKRTAICSIPKKDLLCVNDELFEKLQKKMNQ